MVTVRFGSAYDVPPAKVEVFYPKGFRVSIPGIKESVSVIVFALHLV